MADTRLTRIGPLRCLQLCWYAILRPEKLVASQAADEETRTGRPAPEEPELPSIYQVRQAFWGSLVWVLGSIMLGAIAGFVLRGPVGTWSAFAVAGFQIGGATILLWATLFVRGWEIQTFGGVTLTERVNRWIFRLLYCLGTGAIAASIVIAY